MIIFNKITGENQTNHNPNRILMIGEFFRIYLIFIYFIRTYSYRILIIGDTGSGKANAFLNLINHQPDIDKIYLYAKDLYESQYQLLIKKVKMQEQNMMIQKV